MFCVFSVLSVHSVTSVLFLSLAFPPTVSAHRPAEHHAILVRRGVIPRTPATFGKSQLLIKGYGHGVRFAYFQKYASRAAPGRAGKRDPQQRSSDSCPPVPRTYCQVENFHFIRG